MTRTLAPVDRKQEVVDRTDENVRRVVLMLLDSRRLDKTDLMPVLGIARSTAFAKVDGPQRFTVGEVALLAEFFEVPPSAFLVGPDALKDALLRAARDVTTLRKPEQQQRAPHRTARPARPPLALVA